MSKPRLTGGYFGTRGPDKFSPYFLTHIDGAFIDITAGTGQFPYYLATQKHLRVGLIERCPYVGMLLESIFTGEGTFGVNWEPRPFKGYLWEKVKSGELFKTFSRDTAAAIDGFMVANDENPLALHAMARSINRHYTYRGRQFGNIGIDGHLCKDYPPERVLASTRKTYKKLVDLRLRSGRHWVHIGDSVKAIKKIPARWIEGGTVYADPAWPYHEDLGGKNPYVFAYEKLSSIMLQKQLTLDAIWSIEKEKQIYSDVATWINTAFARGAAKFILCSQDTNFPSEADLLKWVKKNWKLIKHESTDRDYSKNAGKAYRTYWFHLEARS